MPAARVMSNLQIIEELCRICEALNFIVKVQADALAQMGAVVMEEERADVGRALSALIGHDEAPDNAEDESVSESGGTGEERGSESGCQKGGV